MEAVRKTQQSKWFSFQNKLNVRWSLVKQVLKKQNKTYSTHFKWHTVVTKAPYLDFKLAYIPLTIMSAQLPQEASHCTERNAGTLRGSYGRGLLVERTMRLILSKIAHGLNTLTFIWAAKVVNQSYRFRDALVCPWFHSPINMAFTQNHSIQMSYCKCKSKH